MVFQKANPFPKSIYENIAWAAANSRLSRQLRRARRRACLRQAALWDEVKDKLDSPGSRLSGGQQQRLCIARTLAVAAGGDSDGRAGIRPGPDRHT